MSLTPDMRADAQRRVIDEFMMLTPGEADAHGLFSHLAHATNDELLKLGLHRTDFQFSPDSGSFGSAYIRAVGAKVSDELVQGWRRFADLYPRLIARNPRLELRDLMQDISERTEHASWPHMHEWAIEKWVADGAPDGEMSGTVDADIRDRLLELHPILNGWLYLDEKTMNIVFAETKVFRQVKVRLDEERNEKIRKEKQRHEELQERWRARMGKYQIPPGSGYIIFSDDDGVR